MTGDTNVFFHNKGYMNVDLSGHGGRWINQHFDLVCVQARLRLR